MEKDGFPLFRKLLNIHRINHHKIVERLGLYYGQPITLMILNDNGEMSQKELSERLNNTPASVAVSVKRMEKAGMLTKTVDPNDMRINKISLTDYGRELAVKCRESFYYVDRQMVKDFTEEEIEILNGFYSRMINNLKDIDLERKE